MHRISCNTVLTLLVFLGLEGEAALSQVPDSSGVGSFRVAVSAGITTFSLGDLRNFTTGLISDYNTSGLPMKLQRDYPPNLLAGAELFFTGLSPWQFGLGGAYTWTSAYGLYADYAGTLDMHSKVTVISAYLAVRYALLTGSRFQPFLDVRGGISRVSLSIDEKIDVPVPTGENLNSNVTGQKIGVQGEGGVGLRYPLGAFALAARVGYKYSSVSSMEVRLTGFGQDLGSGQLAFDINVSGLVGMLSLEVSL
jgi:hypothetical protein